MPLSKIQFGNNGRRNMVINGAMQVAQRGTSTTGMQNSGAIFTCDRFSYRRGGTWTNLQVKHEQVDVTDSLPLSVGLRKALRVTCTTAEGSVPSGSVSSGEATAIGHYFEKGDTHRLGVGSSSMSVSTLSFYVKASIATTYGIAIGADQHTTSQRIQIPFTVSQANVYERISVTIPAYNVALDSDADTTNGWNMHFVLDGFASAKTASTWNSNASSAEQVVLLPNGVSTTGFSNTTNATFEITGVQLERGNAATDFEHRSFGEELALCQRYFSKLTSIDVCTYVDSSGSAPTENFTYAQEMRTAPTCTLTRQSGDAVNLASVAQRNITADGHNVYLNPSSNNSMVGFGHNAKPATYTMEAEL
tara:strand:- start:231 stop:1316 length:1086 start_codon:yes stop_codon:yes gene_type:complete